MGQYHRIGGSVSPDYASVSHVFEDSTYRDKELTKNEYTLKEVVRQKEGSTLISEILKLRKLIERKQYFMYGLKSNPEMSSIEAHEVAKEYLRSTDEIFIITYTNKRALAYNYAVRDEKGYPMQTVQSGEQLMVVKNFYGLDIEIMNGDIIEVVDVESAVLTQTAPVQIGKNKKRVTLTFQKLSFKTGPGNKIHTHNVILDLLYSNEGSLTSIQNKALYINTIIRLRKQGITKHDPNFSEALLNDPYFSALQVKYGYAGTCHKAQGGEWKRCFIDFDRKKKAREEDLRWAYTALTRAKEDVFLINPPYWDWRKLVSNDQIQQSRPAVSGTPSYDTEVALPGEIKISEPWKSRVWKSRLAPLKGIEIEILWHKKHNPYQEELKIHVPSKNEGLVIKQYFKKQEASRYELSGGERVKKLYHRNADRSLDLEQYQPVGDPVIDGWLPLLLRELQDSGLKIIGLDTSDLRSGYLIRVILVTDVRGSYLNLHINGDKQLTTIEAHSSRGNNDRTLQRIIEEINS